VLEPVDADVAAGLSATAEDGGAVSDGGPGAAELGSVLDAAAATAAGTTPGSSWVSVIPAVTSRAVAAAALAVTAQRAARPPSAMPRR
jgi:hypothetical protein